MKKAMDLVHGLISFFQKESFKFLIAISKMFQMIHMGGESQSHFWMLEVRYIVFPASFLDDFTDGRIVHVGDVWE